MLSKIISLGIRALMSGRTELSIAASVLSLKIDGNNVASEIGISCTMEAQALGRKRAKVTTIPKQRRIMELNPGHPLVADCTIATKRGGDPAVSALIQLLFRVSARGGKAPRLQILYARPRPTLELLQNAVEIERPLTFDVDEAP